MKKIETVLEMPEDAYWALVSSGYTKERISKEAKNLLSAHLFKTGVLSLGKAAELAGLSVSAFIDLLNELGIPVIDYDDEELQAELNTVKALRK